MVNYELSNKADEDLTEIYTFSYNRFGELKANAYLLALEECFCMLMEQPLVGRKIDKIRTGYLQYEHTSHSIAAGQGERTRGPVVPDRQRRLPFRS